MVDATQSFSCWPKIEIKKETFKIEFILRFSTARIRPKFKKNFQISIFNFATSEKISTSFYYMFGYLLEPCIEIWNFFFKFGRVMAIEKSQKST